MSTAALLRLAVAPVVVLSLATGCGGNGDDVAAMAQTTKAARTMPSPDPAALPACPRVPHVAPRTGGLPPLTLPCLGDGPAVRLSDLRGRPMVLNVWAAWCTNCADEAPYFRSLHERAGDRLRFFGVHYKAGRAYGLQSAHDFGIFYPSVHDPSGSSGRETVLALRATNPPQTFFVTADGRVAYVQRGVVVSQHQLDALVARYLGVHV